MLWHDVYMTLWNLGERYLTMEQMIYNGWAELLSIEDLDDRSSSMVSIPEPPNRSDFAKPTCLRRNLGAGEVVFAHAKPFD